MSVNLALSVSGLSIVINVFLAIIKITVGIIGNSYALVADGIESTADIVSSIVVWSGIQISTIPPDENHPYGHGKAESIAGVCVAFFLLGTALLIAVQSIREILTPHHCPEWYTLVVLFGVILVKEFMYRTIYKVGDSIDSCALKSDAWHHRSDAFTSLAAFFGILIAVVGGEGYESADDWAALVACSFIVYNGINLLRMGLDEVMDAAISGKIEDEIRKISQNVKGVVYIEKCRIRKSGLGLLMDLHVVVDGEISVYEGHKIGHAVKDSLLASHLPIDDVVIHIEPNE